MSALNKIFHIGVKMQYECKVILLPGTFKTSKLFNRQLATILKLPHKITPIDIIMNFHNPILK